MKVDSRTRVFDKRVVQRYIRAGRVTKEEYGAWLAALPNTQENIMPSNEGGDSDGYEGEDYDDDDYDDEDDDDDDDDVNAVAAPRREPVIAAAPPVAAPAYGSSAPHPTPAAGGEPEPVDDDPSADDLFGSGNAS